MKPESAQPAESIQDPQTVIPGAEPPAPPAPGIPEKRRAPWNKGKKYNRSAPAWNKGLKKGMVRKETPEQAAHAAEAEAPGANQEAINHSRGAGGPQTDTGKPTEAGEGLNGIPSQAEIDKQDKGARCRRAGMQTADTVVLMARSFMGPEWGYRPPMTIEGTDPPLVYDERKELQLAYAETFEYYGWERFPSWAAMPLATFGFAMARMNMPETQKRMQSLREKFAGWWAMRKVRKAQEAAAPAAVVDPAGGAPLSQAPQAKGRVSTWFGLGN